MASREADAPKPAEPHATNAAAAPALETVKAEASKAATGHARANPLENDLLQGLLSRSTGGLRMGSSGTQHAFLGSASGDGNLMATLAAAGY